MAARGVPTALLCLVATVLVCSVVAEVSSDWMLHKKNITEARGGKHRGGMLVSSKGNAIKPLVDGLDVFRSLYEDMEAAEEGDFIHGVGFDETADMVLMPSLDDEEMNKKSTLANTLLRAIERGVHVRLLFNLNAYQPLNAVQFCYQINFACPDKNCCVPDKRHYSTSGAIHTKLWVIQRPGGAVGYVGGLDVTAGRFDTSAHNGDKLKDVQPPLIMTYAGWHDTMYRVEGLAVTDLAMHFWQRWNDPATPAPTYKPSPFDWRHPDVNFSPGGLDVQVLRTLSCRAAHESGYFKRFAPHGEYTIRDAFVKMVNNAREYLYLADQFVFYPEMLAIVKNALPRLKKVVIMTTSAHSWTKDLPLGVKFSMATQMRNYYQYTALSQLHEDIRGKNYADRVHVYELVRPGGDDQQAEDLIYVHSKNYFADDKFAILGSAGIERAAFTGDVDVSLGVYDSEGAGADSFVGRLRRKLWAEHLNTSPDDPALVDPVTAVDLFEKMASNPEWRLRKYWPQPAEKTWYTDYLYEFFEGDGRCVEETTVSDELPALPTTEMPTHGHNMQGITLFVAPAAIVVAAVFAGFAVGYMLAVRRVGSLSGRVANTVADHAVVA